MKILYYIGESVTLETKMVKGVIDEKAVPLTIKSEKDAIVLDRLESVETSKAPGGATMIKAVNAGVTVFLNVPRIYIERGNGFCLSNYFKTMKLKRILETQIK